MKMRSLPQAFDGVRKVNRVSIIIIGSFRKWVLRKMSSVPPVSLLSYVVTSFLKARLGIRMGIRVARETLWGSGDTQVST